jgi:hypothetical protein
LESDQQALDSFRNDTEQNTARGDYFGIVLKIHYFTEPTALDKDGTSLYPNTRQAQQMRLSTRSDTFASDTRCARLLCIGKVTALAVGVAGSVVHQSMYIFKQALTG